MSVPIASGRPSFGDQHKKTIAVAADASASVQFYGTIANTPTAIRSLLRKFDYFDPPPGGTMPLAFKSTVMHRVPDATQNDHRRDAVREAG